ncbi:MAG: hypothetical protein QGH27_10670 [SAR324 cluster bacterium]|nr:hypothetical protein [SAR324 cluster bacterium]
MVKIWFLLVLLSVQDGDPLIYKGIMGYDSESKCLENGKMAEDFMMEMEMRKGTGDERTVRMESFCIPFDIFDQKKKTKGFES